MFNFFERRTKYVTPGHFIFDKETVFDLAYTGYKPRELCFAIGKDAYNNTVYADIKNAPSVIIAGSTGSGKSVCINTILAEAIASNSPNDLKIYIADPKRVDYIMYKDIPHVQDYEVDPDGIFKMIKDIERVMMARFDYLANNKARNLDDLSPEKRPARILLVFDELASMKLKPILDTLENIARLGRATGVHMILATQLPKTTGSDANITSVLKANCPLKIAFRVDNIYNSRAILDETGAELLNGHGDGLIRGAGKGLTRFQGLYFGDEQIQRVIEFWRPQPLRPSEATFIYNEIEKNDAYMKKEIEKHFNL